MFLSVCFRPREELLARSGPRMGVEDDERRGRAEFRSQDGSGSYGARGHAAHEAARAGLRSRYRVLRGEEEHVSSQSIWTPCTCYETH